MTSGGGSDAPVIELPQFEGPLELLLTLVERRRLPITEVSLASVADQYLSHIRSSGTIDHEALADFLPVAARLLVIKSRALLPQLESSTGAEDDSAEDLVRRLETYRVFKLLATDLAERDAAGRRTYGRGSTGRELDGPAVLPLEAFPVDLLADLLLRVESRDKPRHQPLPPPPRRASVDERLMILRQRLVLGQAVEWSAVSGDTVDEMIATLLAVLEMVRRGELAVEQPRLFGPIQLRLLEQPTVPSSGDTLVRQP